MKARRNGFSAQFATAIEKLVREEGEDDGDDEASSLAYSSSPARGSKESKTIQLIQYSIL